MLHAVRFPQPPNRCIRLEPPSSLSGADMSIFRTILGKIFPSSHPAVAAATGSPAAAPVAAATAETASAIAAAPPVDVNALLEGYASKNPEKFNWQTSIVDLMKLLGLDSSFNACVTLAKELYFPGDTSDSASMNMWLHKAVVQSLRKTAGSFLTRSSIRNI